MRVYYHRNGHKYSYAISIEHKTWNNGMLWTKLWRLPYEKREYTHKDDEHDFTCHTLYVYLFASFYRNNEGPGNYNSFPNHRDM